MNGDLTLAVQSAIDSLRGHFGQEPEVTPDGAGGAHVVIKEVAVGTTYDPAATWMGFHLNAAYPHSDVYPHYVGRVERSDQQAHGSAVQAVEWQGRPALQLSRRSNRWNPTTDNATLKAEKVRTWFSAL
ncbi:hypothetical protein [Terrabacter sp. C0L_2]|uniref:hypothetical protein n=1 Tax=Terrabacter sp. C0L_2 TaxID=3108389 RepID=UPI002ED53374|nr:hypothetical protein U5C87_00100 [Terrabacter sp. C0L_2]